MENTLQIIEINGIQTVSARELYKGLEISWRFSEWWKSNSKDFVENEDFTSVGKTTLVNNGAEREIQDYAISIDMAKAICLMSKTEIGKKYRTYLINLEKAWNEPGAVMARALEIAHKTLADCQKQVALMQPKADVYDKICNSDTLKPVDQVASNLGYGKNNFFALMRGMGIFYYSSADADGKRVNLPKQEYKDRGYFVTKEEPYNRGDKDCLYTKIYVTGKGETWLAKKLGEETAESFLKATDKMLEKELMHKAIINNPESDKTIFNTYSLMQVAKLSGETVETIINYCQLQKYFDEDGKPTLYGTDITGYITNFGSFTENGKNAIVSVFSQIRNGEKGLKSSSIGKAE